MDQRSSAQPVAVDCVITEQWIGRVAVIGVSGVLDMLTAPRLQGSITGCVSKGPAAVVIDLTNVDFLASAGMSLLLTARDQVWPATGFGVVAHGPATSRPLTLMGLADVIGLYPSVAEACSALGE